MINNLFIIIFVTNYVFKTFFTKRNLVKYHYFINIYIVYVKWIFGIVKSTFFYLNIIKVRPSLLTFDTIGNKNNIFLCFDDFFFIFFRFFFIFTYFYTCFFCILFFFLKDLCVNFVLVLAVFLYFHNIFLLLLYHSLNDNDLCIFNLVPRTILN